MAVDTTGTDKWHYSYLCYTYKAVLYINYCFTVYLQIISMPAVSTEFTVNLEASDTILPFILTCTTTGAPPSKIIWLKDGVEIDIASNMTMYSEKQVLINKETARYETTLAINGVGETLVGNFTCAVSNGPHSNTVNFEGELWGMV